MGADDANLQGEEASKDGRPLSDNPYEDGTEDNLSWTDGWNAVTQVTGTVEIVPTGGSTKTE